MESSINKYTNEMRSTTWVYDMESSKCALRHGKKFEKKVRNALSNFWKESSKCAFELLKRKFEMRFRKESSKCAFEQKVRNALYDMESSINKYTNEYICF